MSASNKIQFTGNSTLMKELQRTLSFLAYNTLLKSGESMSTKKLQDNALLLYFGDLNNPDSMGYAEQLMKGFGPFSAMFEESVDVSKGTRRLKMKSIYHCLSNDIFVSTDPQDKGISMPVLSSKRMNNRVRLSARSIWEFAKSVEKHGKKALAIVMDSEYADTAKTGIFPSGKCYDDYLLFIREKMCKEIGAVVVDNDDDEVTSTASGNEVNTQNTNNSGSKDVVMKEGWFFHGYIAFALWGPILPDGMDPSYQTIAFMSDDSGEKVGRRQSKASQINDTKTIRSSSLSTGSLRDTSSKTDFLLAASIAQQNIDSNNVKSLRELDIEMGILKEKVKRAERAVDRISTHLSAEMINEANNNVYKKFEEANEVLRNAENELEEFVKKFKDEKNKRNPYEDVVRDTLSLFHLDQNQDDTVTPKAKKLCRSNTPMSSIDIIMEKEDDNDNVSQNNNDTPN